MPQHATCSAAEVEYALAFERPIRRQQLYQIVANERAHLLVVVDAADAVPECRGRRPSGTACEVPSLTAATLPGHHSCPVAGERCSLR